MTRSPAVFVEALKCEAHKLGQGLHDSLRIVSRCSWSHMMSLKQTRSDPLLQMAEKVEQTDEMQMCETARKSQISSVWNKQHICFYKYTFGQSREECF